MFLALAGLIAGVIDAVAGGGGLITLPTLILVLGPGAQAIGTNKVGGTVAALVALIVYARGKHFDWKKSIFFTIAVAIGAFTGSKISPILPISCFRWFLIVTCPLILWAVYEKDFWIQSAPKEDSKTSYVRMALAGLFCGAYDGVWGPGGGTFMFLALLFVVKLPLLQALAASKFANTTSAGTALISYGASGFVHWKEGGLVAAGIAIGAYFGATHATKRAQTIVRPALVLVVALLILKLFLT